MLLSQRPDSSMSWNAAALRGGAGVLNVRALYLPLR